MSPQLELSTFLDAIRRRWRLLVGLRAATAAVVGISVVLAWVAALFWIARPSPDALIIVSALAVAAIAGWVLRSARPAMRPPDDRRLARFIEEQHPEFNDALAAAVQVRERDSGFARALVADAAIQARSVSPAEIVRREQLRQAMGRGLVACALLLVTGGASLEPFQRALDAARVRFFPSNISIAVQPGDARVLAGRPLTLRATVSGVPRGFDAAPVVVVRSEADSSRQEPMIRDGDGFRLEMPALAASFVYDVRAAGVRSPEYRVTVSSSISLTAWRAPRPFASRARAYARTTSPGCTSSSSRYRRCPPASEGADERLSDTTFSGREPTAYTSSSADSR